MHFLVKLHEVEQNMKNRQENHSNSIYELKLKANSANKNRKVHDNLVKWQFRVTVY